MSKRGSRKNGNFEYQNTRFSLDFLSVSHILIGIKNWDFLTLKRKKKLSENVLILH